jgi:hypothetical protein
MARKKSKNMYFTPEVEEYIVLYNNTEDMDERNRLYNERIQYALDKLSENIIRTFKFYYTDGDSYEDVKHSVVTFLLEKLPNYTQDKGKAFSYLSIVAKNYLILHNTRNYKKLVSKSQTVDTEAVSEMLYEEHPDDQYKPSKFVDEFIKYWDLNLEKCFSRKQDQKVVDSIVHLFRTKDHIELFNKKAIYVYVREMSDVSTQQITRIVKVLKMKYIAMYKDYQRLGYIPTNKTY